MITPCCIKKFNVIKIYKYIRLPWVTHETKFHIKHIITISYIKLLFFARERVKQLTQKLQSCTSQIQYKVFTISLQTL
jgi:hypothetical protein